MGEILILKSINGRILTNKLIDSWFDTNEMFIIKKSFSNDQYSVEITFIDEERADMMSDLLSTCYGDYISISRPQILISSLNTSYEEEREPSPVHLSSALSTSSRVSCFSQRLVELDKKKTDNKIRPTIGRGRNIETDSSKIDMLIAKQIDDDKEDSKMNSTISSTFGRGRGSVFK